MGLSAAVIMGKSDAKKLSGVLLRIVAGLIAEIIMVGGYFAFESIMYGTEAALGSVIFNLIQGGVAIVLSVPLTYMIRIKKLR